jgi:hypothetical protein
MYDALELIVRLGDSVGVKRVCLYYVRACFQILPVYAGNYVRFREAEEVIISPEVEGMVFKELSAEIAFIGHVPLNHGTHSAVYVEYSLRKELPKKLKRLRIFFIHKMLLYQNSF